MTELREKELFAFESTVWFGSDQSQTIPIKSTLILKMGGKISAWSAFRQAICDQRYISHGYTKQQVQAKSTCFFAKAHPVQFLAFPEIARLVAQIMHTASTPASTMHDLAIVP